MDQNSQLLRRTAWSLLYGAGTQLPLLVSFIWVARYVSPEGFGTMAIAWLVAGFGQIFLLETIGDALVRRGELAPQERDATFWSSLLLGLLLTGAVAASAGLAADVFNDEALRSVLPVLAIRLIFDALAIVPDALLRRADALRTLALRSAVANVLAAAAAIGMARAGYGVWALVTQQVVLGAINAAIAWSAAPFRPSLHWRTPADVLSYLRAASLFRLVDFSSANLDRFMIGFYRSPTELGYYSIAQRIQVLGLELVAGNVLRLVALPLFARASRDRTALKASFLKALRAIAFLTFPSITAMILLMSDLLPTVFGPQWLPAIPVIQVLLIEAFLTTLAMLHSALLRAIGRPDLWLRVQLGAFLLSSLLVLGAVQVSVFLVAVAMLVKAMLLLPAHLVLVRNACGFTMSEYLRALAGPVLCSAGMAVAMISAERALDGKLGPFALVGAMVLAGLCSFAILAAVALRSRRP